MSAQRGETKGSKRPLVLLIDDLEPATVRNHETGGRQSEATEHEVIRIRDGPDTK